jgi:hypothetical protein
MEQFKGFIPKWPMGANPTRVWETLVSKSVSAKTPVVAYGGVNESTKREGNTMGHRLIVSVVVTIVTALSSGLGVTQETTPRSTLLRLSALSQNQDAPMNPILNKKRFATKLCYGSGSRSWICAYDNGVCCVDNAGYPYCCQPGLACSAGGCR